LKSLYAYDTLWAMKWLHSQLCDWVEGVFTGIIIQWAFFLILGLFVPLLLNNHGYSQSDIDTIKQTYWFWVGIDTLPTLASAIIWGLRKLGY